MRLKRKLIFPNRGFAMNRSWAATFAARSRFFAE
jgi:hypothetical protein